LSLDSRVILGQVFDGLLQLSHVFQVAFRTGLLDVLAPFDLLVLTVVLLLGQVRARLLEVLNLDAGLLLSFLALDLVLGQVFLFDFQLLAELLYALTASIDLVGHAIVLFNARRKLSKP